MKKENFNVTGMTCAACQANVTRSVKKLDGINFVDVNLLTGRMVVEFDEKKVSSNEIEKAVQKIGYGAEKETSIKNQDDDLEDEYALKWKKLKDNQLSDAKTMKNRLICSLVLLIPLLYIAMAPMIGLPTFWFFDGVQNALLFALVQLILTTVVLIINKKFFISGFKALVSKSPNMDSLVAIGASSAYVYGLVVILVMSYFIGNGNLETVHKLMHSLYLESSATILTLVTLGKYLETRSKLKTSSSLEKLSKLAPNTATVIHDGKEELIRTKDIKIGDVIVIRTGDIVAVDGEVIEGEGLINQAPVTGEAIPVKKSVGDNVISASICENGSFKLKAKKVGGDTTIAGIIRLVDEAVSSKAPISKVADRVSGVFVPIVISLALLTLVIWLIVSHDFGYSLSNAISVLVISCPCALGLATPVAIMVGTGRSASFGVLIKSAEKLELMSKSTVVVLDKTGTITNGKPVLTDIEILSQNVKTEDIKRIIYNLELNSNHAIAFAIKNSLSEENVEKFKVKNFKEISGRGVQGEIDKKLFFIGNAEFAREKLKTDSKNLENAIFALKKYSKEGKTAIFVFDEKEVLACVAVADEIRDSSKIAIKNLLKLGFRVIMLTGDNEIAAKTVAKNLGITEVISNVLPADKDKQIKALQDEHEIVVMVGDGINDSPALSRADIGIAVSSGTDIAIDSADIILTKNSLEGVVNAYLLSRAVMNNIKMNLFWAFFYNAVSIPIAMGLLIPICGLAMSPMIASLAMSVSSVCVVLNALRLSWYDPNKKVQKLNKNMENLSKNSIINKKITNNITDKEKFDEEVDMKIIMQVGGMMCQNCERHVTEALRSVAGVKEVSIDKESSDVTVLLNKDIDEKLLISAVEDAGYRVLRITKNK